MVARRVTMFAVVALLVADAAQAAPLVTPPLRKGTNPSFECGVVNVSNKSVGPVLIEIVGETGIVLNDTSVSIPAGATRSVSAGGGAGFNHCRVTGITKTKARITLCTRDASFNCLQSVTIP